MTTRDQLLQTMRDLAARGIDCMSCRGTCCTFEANSMRITADEARIIADHLRERPDELADWMLRLRATITRFGLDRPEPGDGRRGFARRRYTCTFHDEASGRCALPFATKPLGCLAFNPEVPGQTHGGACATAGVDADDAAQERAPIPVAVLDRFS